MAETFDIEPNPAKDVIQFGKYKGTPIKDLPDDYLSYLLDDIESLGERDPWIAKAIKIEWENRK